MAELEFKLIDRYFRDSGLCFSQAGLDLGIGDDCALLSLQAGEQLAVSMDLLQPGSHFPDTAIPELIARRSLAVNLSDLAAAGAQPLCFTLGLSLPGVDEAWLEAFTRGLLKSATRYSCPLAGGDLIRGRLHIAVQVHGRVPAGKALLRSGARPGDQVFVTGTLGDGAAGLALMQAYEQGGKLTRADNRLAGDRPATEDRDFLIGAFYTPEPRLAAGIALRGLASAAIDISDGLLRDLGHITQASGSGANLEIDALPFSAAMMNCIIEPCRVTLALTGGDDYELCVTVAPENCEAAQVALAEVGVSFKRIGEIVEEPGIRCVDQNGEPQTIEDIGYSHFGREE